MLFNSIEFIIYFPIVFILFWTIFNRLRIKIRNWYLVAVSYVFYGWWDYRFLGLIILTSAISFSTGLGMERCFAYNNDEKRAKRCAKGLNTINILLNLGILFLFKYYNFFITEIIGKLPFLKTDSLLIDFILPIGISFYTFQALSYTIDVYRKDIKATKDISAYFAYISFFPQLVAGPIEKAKNLLPQFFVEKKFSYEMGVDGCRQILWGFFKKIVIADPCGEYVNYIFGHYANLPGLTLIAGSVMFTFQIYCDFSGYSDIAIGTARLFGINLTPNFRFPYFSKNISEFWRRWHISLTKWFTDYIYIPLGGSRNGKLKWIRNILIVFLISGLWHGANWTFILWGLFNALLLIVWILSRKNYKNENSRYEKFAASKTLFSIIIFFAITCLGWIFFRAESIEQLFGYFNRIFSQAIIQKPYLPGGINEFLIRILIPIAILLGVEWFHRYREHGLEISYIKSTKIRWAVYYFFIIYISFYFFNFHQDVEAFIYFQF